MTPILFVKILGEYKLQLFSRLPLELELKIKLMSKNIDGIILLKLVSG